MHCNRILSDFFRLWTSPAGQFCKKI